MSTIQGQSYKFATQIHREIALFSFLKFNLFYVILGAGGMSYNGFALEAVLYSGALIGNADTENGIYVNAEGCYAATAELSVLGSGGFSKSVLSPDGKCYVKNCYATRTQAEHDYSTEAVGMLETVNLRKMQGGKAREYMRGLDYKDAYTVTDGTPVLRLFENYAESTRRYVPEEFTMTFDTNGGNEIDSIAALPYTKLKLPTPKRGADIFAGWYVDEDLTVKFPIDYMPEFSLKLYAKYISVSVVQDFEDYNVLLGSDLAVMSPAMAEYNQNYVHGGLRSLMRIGEEAGEKTVAVFNDDSVFENTGKRLEKGKNYILTAWVYINKTDNPRGGIKLVHFSDYETPAFNLPQYSIASIEKIPLGQWQQISVIFKAESDCVGISLPGSTAMYLDDIVVTPTDKTAAGIVKDTVYTPEDNNVATGDTNEENPGNNGDLTPKGGYWLKKTYKRVGGISPFAVAAISVGAAFAALAAVFILILLIRKKKFKAGGNRF